MAEASTNIPTFFPAKRNLLSAYVEASEAPFDQKSKALANLTPDELAKLFKFHLAFQVASQTNLTREQVGLLTEALASLSEDLYNGRDLQKASTAHMFAAGLVQRAKLVFSKNQVYEIFGSLSTGREKLTIVNQYQNMVSFELAADRRFAFGDVSAVEQSNLIRTHLALQIAERDLAPRQIDFVIDIIRKITPEIYSAKRGTDTWAVAQRLIEQVDDQVLNFFPKKEAFEIFASFGGKQEATNVLIQPGLSQQDKFSEFVMFREKEKSTGPIRRPPVCSCSSESDYCAWWKENAVCFNADYQCTHSGGCGTLGLYLCDGFCYQGNFG